jgi:hypothetical protein
MSGNEWDAFVQAGNDLKRAFVRRAKVVVAQASKALFWLAGFGLSAFYWSYVLQNANTHLTELLSQPEVLNTAYTAYHIGEVGGLTWGAAKTGHRFFKAGLVLLAMLKRWSDL